MEARNCPKHVADAGEKGDAYGDCIRTRENNIKIDPKEAGWENLGWIHPD
jgi:hypothetical protein